MGSIGALAFGDSTVVIGGYEIGNGSIHKVDSDKILDLLEQTPNPADRQRLKDLYKQQTGRDMDDDMNKKLVDPTGNRAKLDAYNALQEGRTSDAAAARMEQALDGINDTKAFYKQLEGKPEWQRKQIIEAYGKRHPEDPNAFVNLVNGQLGGLDVEKANRLAFSKDDAATGAV
jgi:acyl-CoA-binding protein